ATASIGFSSATDGGVVLEDLTATFELVFGFDADGAPQLQADLANVSLGSLQMPFGDVATLTAGDLTLDLTPAAGAPRLTIGGTLDDPSSGVGIEFDEALEALDGWG